MAGPSLTDADVARHAEHLQNRLRKRYKHLAGRFRKRGIEAFRLYDWDIPEVRATVDWYKGHLVASEYTRTQTDEVEDWLERVVMPGAEALGVPKDKVHLKRRRTGARGARYERLDRAEARFEVREGELSFLVNLDDFIDTGLFLDHRLTRARVGKECAGKTVLNLFAYTGSFTCYAAAGGAERTTTVDISGRYLDWARDNLALNGFEGREHGFVRADAADFLADTPFTYDLAIVDPPSFSGREDGPDFDVQADHPALLAEVAQVMNPGGRIYFSTNHQRFMPNLDRLRISNWREITAETIPEDFRNPQVHRAFILEV